MPLAALKLKFQYFPGRQTLSVYNVLVTQRSKPLLTVWKPQKERYDQGLSSDEMRQELYWLTTEAYEQNIQVMAENRLTAGQ